MKYQRIIQTPREPAAGDSSIGGCAATFGAVVQDHGVRFAVWAPSQPRVDLQISGREHPLPMIKRDDGLHVLEAPGLGPGTRYRFILPDGMPVPDPASRFQPDDVHGFSEVVDPNTYAWRDAGWTGRPWTEAVIYQLHVGTFTPEGTYRAVIGKLGYLRDLGVTALQLMPLGDFPGRWDWGYDGAYPYAPDATYGAPDDLKALIDAAHACGLMVFLDAIYNHFGPEGAYVHVLAPEMFTGRHHTPWGKGVNTDGPHAWGARAFFIENALYWIGEFHADGLRLDAVHELKDDSDGHILDELAATVRAHFPDRRIHLILENEENEASKLERGYTAQWNDDVHHVLHCAATGEACAYYADYIGDSQKLGRALAEGFAFQGEMMPFRGSPRGEPSAHMAPSSFVAFLQNHDQVGNRPGGERIAALAGAEAVRAVTAVYLLLPQIPMLFMGEEWGAKTPFPFFCDFGGDLGEHVREGRRKEVGRCGDACVPPPDPLAEETFLAAKLPWQELEIPAHAAWLAGTRALLTTRRAWLKQLSAITCGGTWEIVAPGAVVVRWVAGRERLQLCANLSAVKAVGFPPPLSHMIWQEGSVAGSTFWPWSVQWSVGP